MLPANDNSPPATLYDFCLFQVQAKRKKAERDGMAFFATWVPRLTIEGLTSANKCALVRAAALLSDEAREWINKNRPLAWRR